MEANEYRCAACHGIFEKAWSEEEALAEKQANGFADVECAVVCDDCYRKIMGLSATSATDREETSHE